MVTRFFGSSRTNWVCSNAHARTSRRGSRTCARTRAHALLQVKIEFPRWHIAAQAIARAHHGYGQFSQIQHGKLVPSRIWGSSPSH